ncbi:MAG: serine/threonine protein kinase [Myxococcales bacterium]|nr:serine/threonine protein kinase [Myxococcales bacterium]
MVRDVFGIVGKTLAGAFKIEEAIAEGGFGVVYRAEHVAFRAPIALKCLKIPGTITNEQREAFVENFREEAEMLFHLSHQIPEVVRPLHADAMTLPNGTFMPFIAMEWVSGTPLDSIIILREERGQKPLGLRKVVRMLTPIAHALAKAHHFEVPGGGVVSVTHRDLKPENILINTQPGSPVPAKILDFGIAKARDKLLQGVGRITDEGGNPFTPSYGSPEQWLPKRYGQTGPWTDVWGLALTMVECLTGFPPIDGDMHAMMGTALDESRRPSPRNEGVDVSDEAEAVFRRALSVDPKQRYQTIEELWTALETALGIEPSFPRSRRSPASAQLAVPAEVYDLDADDDEPPSSRRSGDLRAFGADPAVSSSGARVGLAGPGELGPPIDPAEYDPLAWDDGTSHLGDSGIARPGSIPPRAAAPAARVGAARAAPPPALQEPPELELDDPRAAPAGAAPATGSRTPTPGHPRDPLASSGITPGVRTPRDRLVSTTPAGGPRDAGASGPERALAADALVSTGTHPAARSMEVLRASGTHPAVRPAIAAHAPGEAAHVRELRSLRRALLWPVVLIVLAVGLTVLDFAVAGSSGGTLALGPVRVRWIAIGLAVLGIGLAFYSLVVDRES